MVLRQKNGLPKYCSYNTDRHGKKRVRFRKSGYSTYLPGQPWSEQFMRAYGDALAGLEPHSEGVGVERTRPGSISALLVRYYRSPEFNGLADSSKKMRKRILDRFREQHGDKLVRNLERRHVKDIIGSMSDRPQAANNLLKFLKVILNFAVDIEMVDRNVATGIRRYPEGGGFHTWTEQEIEHFESVHAVGSKARLAMGLLLYLGQRRSDIVKIGHQHFQGTKIKIAQQKTGANLLIPVHPDLMNLINLAPRDNLTILTNSSGQPFSAAGFGNWFRIQCNQAGLQHCSAHGLRKAAARRLAEAGCSDFEISSITGHKSLSEVSRYTRDAKQELMAERAVRSMPGSNKEQNLSNLSTRLDNSSSKALKTKDC
ncbi:MAG: tyrosine-type recombinase/integrase [Aquisalinus sp.]|nr:tyrosine-type recombinase/integrase [Aquisalinus sp.]